MGWTRLGRRGPCYDIYINPFVRNLRPFGRSDGFVVEPDCFQQFERYTGLATTTRDRASDRDCYSLWRLIPRFP
jgi:hypothetical protein